MSFFTILLIIFVAFRLIQYFMNKDKRDSHSENESSNYKYDDLYKDSETYYDEIISDFQEILDDQTNFIPSKTIISSYGFYLFSIDETNKNIFIIYNEDEMVEFSYNRLESCNINIESESFISIDLEIEWKDTDPEEITIVCFDLGKLIPSALMKYSNYDYVPELAKAREIMKILEDVMHYNKTGEILTSTYDSSQIIEENPSSLSQILDVIKMVEDKENEEEPASGSDASITTEDNILNLSTENFNNSYKLSADNIVSGTPNSNISTDVELAPEIVSDDPQKLELSLSEIENLSKGKFLQADIQSMISEAKMKGLPTIFITQEQLDILKNS